MYDIREVSLSTYSSLWTICHFSACLQRDRFNCCLQIFHQNIMLIWVIGRNSVGYFCMYRQVWLTDIVKPWVLLLLDLCMFWIFGLISYFVQKVQPQSSVSAFWLCVVCCCCCLHFEVSMSGYIIQIHVVLLGNIMNFTLVVWHIRWDGHLTWS